MRSLRIVVPGLLAAAALAGCPFVTSGISGNGFTAAGGSTSSGTHSSTTTGPAGSSTGAGAGGSTACTPGSTQSCYDGGAGSEDVSPCKAGSQTCAGDGSGFGACEGQVTPQPDNCASGMNLHCDLPVPVCNGNVDPNGGRAWGESGDDEGLGIAFDSLGNVVVVGYFHGSLDFGNGMMLPAKDSGSDAFVAKYDPTGNLIWVVQLGDTGDDAARAVTVDGNDNVFVVGDYNHEIALQTPTPKMLPQGPGIFVAEIDKDGHPQWGNGYVGDNNTRRQGLAVALSADGATLAVAGTTAGQITIGSSNTNGGNDYDGLLFTLDSGGKNVGWVQRIKDCCGQDQLCNGVAIGPDGNVVVTGAMNGDVDFGDGAINMHGNGTNVALAKYPAAGGKPMWKQLVGDNFNYQSGNGVAVGSTGDVFLTGTFQKHLGFPSLDINADPGAAPSTKALFVARLQGSGAGIWGKAFTPLDGLLNDASGLAIATDGFGVLVGGYLSDQVGVGTALLASKGGRDGVAFKMSVASGDVFWSKQFGDTNDDKITGVAFDPRKADPLGASAVVGFFTDKVDVGAGPVAGKGNPDIFFARLDP